MLQYIAMKAMGRLASLGDLSVVLVVAAILFAHLAASRRWRASLWWAATVFGCTATTFLLKLGFYSGDLSLSGVALQNPSGHAAMSAVIYGSTAWVISSDMRRWPGRAVLALGWIGVAAIGLSLYLLRMHTAADVLAGWALGGAWAGSFGWLGWRGEAPMRAGPMRVMIAIAIAVLGMQGAQFMARFAPADRALLPPSLAAHL